MIAERIRQNLHRFKVPSPTLPPATTTNAWIIGDKNGWIVDPAAHIDITQAELLEGVMRFELYGVFLTHHHHDHIGAATFLRDQLNIPIICHPETAALLPFEVDTLIGDGETIGTTEQWQTIHTPGHAPGHLCLLSRYDQSLIAGDMVAGEGTILINPSEGSIREYLNSLNLLKKWNPSRLLPAHGQILEPAEDTLNEYIDHRKIRLRQILDLLSDVTPTQPTPKSSLEIAAAIYTELPKKYLGCYSSLVWPPVSPRR